VGFDPPCLPAAARSAKAGRVAFGHKNSAVRASVARRKAMAGKVQMIYMDPPYGIKYASNLHARGRFVARRCANNASWPPPEPLRRNSRLTVDTERPISPAASSTFPPLFRTPSMTSRSYMVRCLYRIVALLCLFFFFKA